MPQIMANWMMSMQLSLNHVVTSLLDKVLAIVKASHMQKMQKWKCLKQKQKQAMSDELSHFPNEVIDDIISFLYMNFESYESTIDQEFACARSVITMLAS